MTHSIVHLEDGENCLVHGHVTNEEFQAAFAADPEPDSSFGPVNIRHTYATVEKDAYGDAYYRWSKQPDEEGVVPITLADVEDLEFPANYGGDQ